MHVYTFYPQRADGGVKGSIALELETDVAARDKAIELLERTYSMADEIAVWRGDDMALMVRREAVGAAAPQMP